MTLPKVEMLNGMGEMVQHAVIADRTFCIFLDDYIDSIHVLDEDILINTIKWSCAIMPIDMEVRSEVMRKVPGDMP